MPNNGPSISDMRRRVQQSRRARNWETSAFSTSTGGILTPPTPLNRGANRPFTSEGGLIVQGHDPIGELIHCHMEGHLGSGGSRPLFESADIQLGFAGQTFPSAQLLLPHTAIYGTEGAFRWEDGYTGGGTIDLEIDGATFLTLDINDEWNRVSIAEEFYANAGQRLSFKVTHNDTTADHDLHGHLTVATKEPLATLIDDPTPVMLGDWEFNESSNNSGSVDAPPGIDEGDLLIALGTIRHSLEPTVTMSGFTEIPQGEARVSGSGESVTLIGLTKVATASEPASYSWSVAGVGAAATTMMVLLVKGGELRGSQVAVGAQPLSTADAGTIQEGEIIVGTCGRFDSTPTSSLPDPPATLILNRTVGSLINRSAAWWWDATAGTSVRTLDQDAPANGVSLTIRVGPA
jgi:hypothetical protein